MGGSAGRGMERGGAWSIGNGVTEFRDSCRFQTRHRAISDSLPDSVECIDLSTAPTFPTPRFSARGKEEGNNSE